MAIIAGRREKPPLGATREELAERLSRAEAEAASRKEKYEGLAGFSAHLSIEDGGRFLRMQSTQDVEVIGLDYCFDDGVCHISDNTLAALRGNLRQGLDGRDVRVLINQSYIADTFWRGTWGAERKRPAGSLERITIIFRLRFRVGDVLMERERKARVEHEVGSNMVRLVGS